MSLAKGWPLLICVAIGALLANLARLDWPTSVIANDARTELRPPPEIALVDVARTFKENNKFRDQMEKMKADVTAFEEKEVKPKSAELEKLKAEAAAAA